MPSSNSLRVSTPIMVVILGCICLYMASGCTGGGSQKPIQARDISGLGYITVNPLDSEENPYAGEYKAWDRWVFNNIRTESVAFLDGNRPENWKVLTARVTNDGWLVPMNEKLRLLHEGIRRGDHDYWTTCPYSVQAEGILEPVIEELRIADQCNIRAGYYHSVPDWLANNPPLFAMLVPSGEIVTYGPLGSGTEDASTSAENDNSNSETSRGGCCGRGEQSYYLYSHNGELLRTNPRFWWWLFFDDIAQEDPAGDFHNRGDGYVFFTDSETDEVLSVWDWNGIPLDTTALPPYRDRHPFMALRTISLLDVYRGQQDSASQ